MTEDQAKKAASALHAVASPMRIQIFLALDEVELMVGDLADRVRLSQSATSQHLKIMTGSGILVFRKDAQRRYYAIEPSIGETFRKLVSIALDREPQPAKR